MSTRLKFRLWAPIMAVSCLPLVVGVLVAWDGHRSQRRASAALALNVRSVRAGEELAIGLRDLRAQLDRYLLSGDDRFLATLPRVRKELDPWMTEAHRAAVTPRERELVGHLTDSYDSLFAGVSNLERVRPEGRPAAVRDLIERAGRTLQPAQEYLDYNEEEIEASSEENQQTAGRMVLGLLLLGVCGPLSGLLAGYAIARAVSRSVIRLSVPVGDAAGTLSEVVGPLTVSAEPGLEELESVLHRMAGEIRAVVERLHQSQREALRAEQLAALGQMAAGFAHEVRNPLMSMKILVQSASARGNGLAGRALAVLEEEINRLAELTTTFLDFARPPRPEKRTFDAREVLEDTVDLVVRRAGQRNVRIECDVPAAPVPIEADAGQVRQVVLNLLLNAVEAVYPGGVVRVRLSSPASQTPQAIHANGDRRWVEIVVEDTGPGLPGHLGQDIFAPFVSTKPTGMGLGLSVCKRIAEAHGGDITASDRQGGGALFCLRLPVLDERELHADLAGH
jgi:signal transduction histidine kinase